MKRFLILCAVALTLGGCNIQAFMQNARDVGQQAREVVEQIKAGYKVAAQIVDASIVATCSKLPQIDNGMNEVIRLWPNPGPETRKWLNAADDALDRATIACTNYKGNGSPNTLLKLAEAFNAGVSAVLAADAAGGT